VAYFTQQQIQELINAMIAAQLDYGTMRPALLAGINFRWLSTLPALFGLPAIAQLNTDLARLNGTERLSDGTAPLEIWLRNAALFTAGTEESKVFQRALDDISHRTSGAPRINVAEIPEHKEAIVHQDDMVPFGFMQGGVTAGASVAKLSVPRFENGQKKLSGGAPVIYLGTGWLLGKNLLITNHHVVNARNEGESAADDTDLKLQAAATKAKFDFDGDNMQGQETGVDSLEAWDSQLDYAVLRISGSTRPPLRRVGKPLQKAEADAYIPVNIIQHPEGTAKKMAIRNNLVTASTETDLRYFTDTKQGSSGSPVLDDQWRVVALHRGSTVAENVKFQGRNVAWVNLGTHIPKIVDDIITRVPSLAPELA